MKPGSTTFLLIASVAAFSSAAHAEHVLKTGSHNRERILVPDAASGTDIVPYIQQGINDLKALGGGALVLAAGNYPFRNADKAVRIENASGIVIRGDGEATVLKQAPGTNANNWFYLLNSSGVTFENLRFQGVRTASFNGDGGYETAIQAEGNFRDLRIRSCSFKFFKSGAIRLLGAPTVSRVTNCAFDSVDNALSSVSYFGSIEVQNGKDILILDNQFSGLRHSAISLRKCESVTISGNNAAFAPALYHSQCSGVYVLDGARKCIFDGNQFSGSVHGFNLQSNAASGIALEDNVIARNIIQARYSGVNLNYTATCGGGFLQAARNSIANNSITGVLSGSTWDEVDHAIFPQFSTLTLISGNSIRKSQVGVNFQQCTQENQVLDNQIEGSNTGVVFNGSGIVSKNYVRSASVGIAADWSNYTAITDNALSGTATRLSVNLARVAHRTISNNCDLNGACD
jgi:hypothetical protein